MDLVSVIIVLAVLGLVSWLVWTYILPLFPPPIRTVVIVVAVVILCILILQWAGLTHLNIGRRG